MKTKIVFRLFKALIFISTLLLYGFTSGTTSQVFFAVALAMYLIELYGRQK